MHAANTRIEYAVTADILTRHRRGKIIGASASACVRLKEKILRLMLLLPLFTLADCKHIAGDVTWTVRPHNGVATLHRNGEPLLVNMVYDEDARLTKYTPLMAEVYSKPQEADIHIHQLPVCFNWKGADDQRSTYKNLAERMGVIVREDPQACILLRLLLWPSREWAQAYPDELVRDSTGSIPKSDWPPVSMMSKRYFGEAARCIEALARLVENGEFRQVVLGYMPCFGVTGELTSFRTSRDDIADYAPCAQREFRGYLLRKYGNLRAMNKALCKDFGSEAAVSLPSPKDFLDTHGLFFRDPVKGQYVSDYYAFNDAMIADGVLDLCRASKKVAPGKIVGLWYGQVLQAAWGSKPIVQHGRYEWRRIARSGSFDFVCTPAYYAYTGLDKPVAMQGLLDSINLYGKLFLFEYDRPTHLVCYMPMVLRSCYVNADGLLPVVGKDAEGRSKIGTKADYARGRASFLERLPAEEKEAPDFGRNRREFLVAAEKKGDKAKFFEPDTVTRVPRNMDETVAMIRRWTSFCMARPCGGLWWWDQEGTTRKAVGGVAFNHPRLMAELKRTNGLFEKAVLVKRGSRAETAIFYDIKSCHYQIPAGGNYLKTAFVENNITLAEAGIPCDQYFFDEIEDIPDLLRYKMIIFLNANYIPQARREWIDRKLKRDGRVIVWFFGSGYLDENGMGIEKMACATGIRFREETAVAERVACEVTDFNNPICAGIGVASAKFGAFDKAPVTPWFSVDDPAARVLGVAPTQRRAVCAMKEMGTWRSVYVPTGPMPVRMVRNLASLAGVHVYTDAEDLNVWASDSIIAVYAYPSAKGRRTLYLPADVRHCEEFFSGKKYPVSGGKIELEVDGATAFCLFVQ